MARRADEKNSFDMMMAEVEGSDSEEEWDAPTPKGNTHLPVTAPPKNNVLNTTNAFAAKQFSKEDSEIDNFGFAANSQVGQQETTAAEIAQSKEWLMRPCRPGEPPLHCYMDRDRSGFNLMSPIYRCYLEAAQTEHEAKASDRFLMTSKKQSGNKTSSYLISCDQGADDRGADSMIGKVRSNNVGSQYLVVDSGLAPDKTAAKSMLRKEHGVVNFEFDSSGPSAIEVWLPHVSASGIGYPWQPSNAATGLQAQVDGYSDSATSSSSSSSGNPSNSKGSRSKEVSNKQQRLIMLKNKKPKWDSAHGGYVLNFQGRVTMSSVKNFQLCIADSSETNCPELQTPPECARVFEEENIDNDVILQFGRTGKDRFTMDVQYPLSLYQAFAICVTCLDGKIADRKGYEYMRKMIGGGLGGDAPPITSEAKPSKRSSISGMLGLGTTSTNKDDKNTSEAKASVQGSITGSNSYAGAFMENMPTSDYVKDKIRRSMA